MDTALYVTGMVCGTVVVGIVACQMSRCRRVEFENGRLVVERDTSREHDLNLSSLRHSVVRAAEAAVAV